MVRTPRNPRKAIAVSSHAQVIWRDVRGLTGVETKEMTAAIKTPASSGPAASMIAAAASSVR
jgi:hypothetical protein